MVTMEKRQNKRAQKDKDERRKREALVLLEFCCSQVFNRIKNWAVGSGVKGHKTCMESKFCEHIWLFQLPVTVRERAKGDYCAFYR